MSYKYTEGRSLHSRRRHAPLNVSQSILLRVTWREGFHSDPYDACNSWILSYSGNVYCLQQQQLDTQRQALVFTFLTS